MHLFGKEVRWNDAPLELEQRMEQVQITDIGLAFERAQDDLLGLTDTSIAAVYRSRQLLSDVVASLPMEQLQGRIVTADTPTVLEEPSIEMTYHEFMSQIVLDLIDDGNAFLWPMARDTNGFPTRLHIAPAGEVGVNWRDDKQLERVYTWRNRKNLVPNRDIYHISINRKSGELRGKGPVAAARDTLLASARAEEVTQKSMTEEEFGPRYIYKHPQIKTIQEGRKVAAEYEDDRASRRKKLLVTGTDTEIEQIPLNLHDAQWIEGRRFTIQQIGRLFGIHGYFLLVESGDSLTYSTTESLFRQFTTQTLRPTYLERIEQVFSRMLPKGRRARFNTDELIRADIVSRYQAYQIGTGGEAFLTPNEVRETEGMSPVPGGDELPKPPKVAAKDMTANQPKEVVRT